MQLSHSSDRSLSLQPRRSGAFAQYMHANLLTTQRKHDNVYEV